jgi:apolipoprotein N-acyltransferase
MIPRVAHALSALGPRRRLIAAFLAGACTVAALPPFCAVPVLWIAVPAWLWLLDGCRSVRASLACGWAFGFGHFLFGLAWISDAFMVDAETFGALAWPAVVSLTFAMGAFFGAVALAPRLCPPAKLANPADEAALRAARALLLAAAWMLQEWVRNWILTGFPWNPMATVWSESITPVGLALQQAVSVIGTFGLSLTTVVAAALPSCLGASAGPRWRWSLAPLALLAVAAGAGTLRLGAETAFVPETRLRLVQPNVPQAEKWRPGLREAHLWDYVALSTQDRPADVKVVIWGEASISFFLDRDDVHRRLAASAAPPAGWLIAGGDRAESETRIFNSLYVITPASDIAAVYDKFHLVPFGEYMPLPDLVPFSQLTGGLGFSAGPGLRTVAVPGLPPFAPLICFEAIFPGRVIADGAPRPQWLLALTNDSWFGTATGPYQHFATARLRAIEEGLPLVRTANTGISAVVDGYGRIVAALGLDRRGVVDAPLPVPVPGVTPFARLGNLIPLACATALCGAALLLRRRVMGKAGTRRA